MKPTETIQVITTIAEIFPRFGQVSDFRIRTWHKAIGDLPFALVLKALDKILMTSKFAPVPADIREVVAELTADKSQSAEEAWLWVDRAIRKCGFYGNLTEWALREQMPECILGWIRRYGWERLTRIEISDVPYVRNEFIKFYTDVNLKKEKERLLPIGFADDIKGFIAKDKTKYRLGSGDGDE